MLPIFVFSQHVFVLFAVVHTVGRVADAVGKRIYRKLIVVQRVVKLDVVGECPVRSMSERQITRTIRDLPLGRRGSRASWRCAP